MSSNSCFAYCTAESYALRQIYNDLHSQYRCTWLKDVLHVAHEEEADLFLFSYGAAVIWGTSQSHGFEILDSLKEYQSHPLEIAEIDEFTYDWGEKPSLKEDNITLPDEQLLTKLAFSYGMAQSVKLGAFEVRLTKTFQETKSIPQNLAKEGKIPLSRKEIRKAMGGLFLERSGINLHVDILDTPDFLWNQPQLETCYQLVSTDLDLGTRAHMLNQRLEILKELFEMLGNELNHQHSSRLEWIIIWLIFIEIILLVLKEIFHIL